MLNHKNPPLIPSRSLKLLYQDGWVWQHPYLSKRIAKGLELVVSFTFYPKNQTVLVSLRDALGITSHAHLCYSFQGVVKAIGRLELLHSDFSSVSYPKIHHYNIT